jgi:TMEM175 potassium channel family protein
VGSRRSLLLDKPRYDRDEAEFGRAVGFIDATYALALTLLVTSLEVGDFPSSWTSVGALYDAVGEQFVTFLIAFAVIASYWLEHHRMFAWFSAIDYPVIVANLFLICAIVLLPFSTRSVGDPSDIDDLALPTVVLAVNVAVCSLLHAVVYALAVRRGLALDRPATLEFRGYLTLSLLPAIVFALSIPIAYAVSPTAARLFWLALIPVSIIAKRRITRVVAREPASG